MINCFYDYRETLHPKVDFAMKYCHLYLDAEIFLAMGSPLTRAFLELELESCLSQAVVGLELERQFNESYLAMSLQDFLGRRWNLMVTSTPKP